MTRPRFLTLLVPTLVILALGRGAFAQAPPTTAPAGAAPATADAGPDAAVFVTDAATGQPVAGAAVEVAKLDGTTNDPPYVQVAVTDAEGRGAVTKGADAMADYLRVVKAGYVPLGMTLMSPEFQARRDFRVALGRGVHVGGIVRNEKGAPVAGATVEIELAGRWDEPWMPLLGGVRVPTAPDGTWRFDDFPEGVRSVRLRFTHPDYAPGDIHSASPRDLRRDKTAITLREGVALAGAVTDAAGAPVEGASVFLGYMLGIFQQATTTGAAGRFRMEHVEPSGTWLLVQKAGFAPARQGVVPEAGQAPLRIKLEPGRTVRGRVTEGGKPVAGATLSVSQWGEGNWSFQWTAHTDASGRFTGSDWPADPVQCTVWGTDQSQKIVTLKAGPDEQAIALDPPLRVSGSVTDARTGKPIDGVRVLCGTDPGYNAGTLWDLSTVATTRAGAFSVPSMSAPYVAACQLAFQAPGYEPATSKPILPNQGAVHLDIALRPCQGSGIQVLDPAGHAVPGVRAVVSDDAKVFIRIQDGRVGYSPAPAPPVTTDADGRTCLATSKNPKGPFVVAFAGKQGYAILTSEQLAKLPQPPRVTLKPWCTVHGTNLKAGKPAPNQTVMLHSQLSASAGRLTVMVTVESEDASDAEGHIVFDHCVPGPALAGRYDTDDSTNVMSETFGGQVTVVEGKPAEVTVGAQEGRKVVGRAVPSAGAGEDWPARSMVALMPDLPPPLPKNFAKMDADAIERWQEEFRNSEAGRKMMQDVQSKSRDVVPKKDGSFTLENVRPGKYHLSIQLSEPAEKQKPPDQPGAPAGTTQPAEQEQKLQAQLVRQVVVDDDGKHADIDLGPLQLKPPPQLKPGELAPPLEATGMDGKTVTLESLRGKYVLLEPWAPGGPPQEMETPAMKAVTAAFGSDPKLAMISLSLMGDADAVRTAAADQKMTWDQWLIGDRLQEFIADWTPVFGNMGLVLIDPQGKLVAVNLHGKAAEDAVAKALGRKPAPAASPGRSP